MAKKATKTTKAKVAAKKIMPLDALTLLEGDMDETIKFISDNIPKGLDRVEAIKHATAVVLFAKRAVHANG